jgi:secreted trypsin-like serine protease
MNKIINGTVVGVLGALSFFVSVISVFPHQLTFCGGQYIGNRSIVTAAHCVDQSASENICIGFGGKPLHDVTSSSFLCADAQKVDTLRIHPMWDPSSMEYDVAVLRLQNDPPLGVVPIRLTNPQEEQEEKDLWILGYGQVDFQTVYNDSTPLLLRLGTGLVVFPSSSFPLLEEVKEATMLVAGSQQLLLSSSTPPSLSGYTDTCQGDSGGPLFTFDSQTNVSVLVGITSWGKGCGLFTFPGVYTRVSTVHEWIDAQRT